MLGAMRMKREERIRIWGGVYFQRQPLANAGARLGNRLRTECLDAARSRFLSNVDAVLGSVVPKRFTLDRSRVSSTETSEPLRRGLRRWF